ncbi:hypothetical protein FACS1894190_05470 [Spirochaetia bacterium]|nr:hypothetical protein FACS1894190_05470 [Spirochaetia bacterium]
MRRIFISLFAILIASQTVFPQSSNSIFAPFVSNLKATTTGRNIVLTWKDSNSVRGPVYVFRSKTPFFGGTQPNQYQGTEIPYGRQTYSEVSQAGDWYYFVAASDESKQKYELIIPFNNMINIKIDGTAHSVDATSFAVPQSMPHAYANRAYDGVPVTPQPFQMAQENAGRYDLTQPPYSSLGQPPYNTLAHPTYTYPSTPVFETSNTAKYSLSTTGGISGITANAQGNFIQINFLSSNPGKNAVLYRSIQPIRRLPDLLTATVIQLGVISPYNDYATAGVPYYYAVVIEEDIRSGRGTISPGYNATFIPAEISARAGSTYAPAPAPTPYTPNTSGTYTPNTSEAYTPNTSEAYQQGGAFSGGDYRPLPPNPLSTAAIREPRVFNQDLLSTQMVQDDFELSVIVRGPIMWRNWGTAKQNLEQYLSVSRRGDAGYRARFYLGQVYYFSGDYRNALTEFLGVQSRYPDEVDTWVKSCLAKLGG